MSLRKLLAAVMVVSMVFGLVGTTVFAQAEAAALEAATTRLQGFGVVTGDPDGGLRLEATITRAELMAVLVRANKLDDVAALVAGTQPFSDVAPDAWYTGYVAIAKAKGWTTGYPDGTFQPSAPVSNAEVLAFLSRVAGLAPAAAAWPENYVKAAVDAGLIPAGLDVAALAGEPAIRGVVFALADAFFLKVRDANGKNLYQRYHDSEAPVVTLDAIAPQTTLASVKASGKVEGAEAAFLNGNPLVLAADGAFAADIELAVGANEIKITAVDIVGNEGSASVSVERINTAAAHIAAPASVSVAAGAGSAVAVVVHDTNGAEIAGAVVTAAVEPAELGTFDAATGTFTAGTKAGSGTLTLMSGDVTATVAVTVTPAALAKIEVTPGTVAIDKGDIQQFTATGYDAFGNAITAVTPTWVVTNADGSATSKAFISSTGSFIGSDTGSYKVTATVDAFSASATAGIYGTAATIKVSGPATLVANDASKATFNVTLVDANGNVAGGVTEDALLLVNAPGLSIDGEAVDTDVAIDIENGVGKFTITADTFMAGLVPTITVADDSDDGLGVDEDGEAAFLDDATAELELVEQVATGIKAASVPKYLTANITGQSVDVVFEVVDQDGEPMLDNLSYDLDVTVSGPGSFDEVEVDRTTSAEYPDEATVTVWSQSAKTGTVTVTATAEGLGSATATFQAALAGAPALIKISADPAEVEASATAPDTADPDDDTVAIFSVEITDDNGIPTPVSGLLDVKVTLAGDADAINWAWESGDVNADSGSVAADDVAEFQVDMDGASATIYVTGTKAGSAKISVSQGSNDVDDVLSGKDADLSSGSGTFSIVAAAPSAALFDTDAAEVGGIPTLIVPASAAKASVNVVVVDQWDNAATVSGAKIRLYASDAEVALNGKSNTSVGSPIRVTTGADGIATVEVSSPPYAGEVYSVYILNGTYGDEDLDPGAVDQVDFAVKSTVAASMTVTLLYNNTTAYSVTAGNEVTVRVKVKDAYGTALTPDNFDQTDFLEITAADGAFAVGVAPSDPGDGAEDVSIQPTWNAATSAYEATVYAFKRDGQSLSVNNTGGPKTLTTTRSVSVKPNYDEVYGTLSEATWDSDVDQYVIEATATKSTPVTLLLADAFGNRAPLGSAATVTFTGDAGLSVRKSTADGVELMGDADGIAVKSTYKLYLVPSGETHYDLTITVESDAGTFSWTIDVDADPDD